MCNYKKISKEEFSHSLVREKAAFEAKGEIIVFITQDIKIVDEYWLYYLTKDIIDGKCEAAFSRQIGYEEHKVERYTREINYPDETRIVSKEDIDRLGLMTFFFSDASSAISKNIFIKLNGYDNKNLPTNEDMYFAYKLIMNGYRIEYAADSKIIHSHDLSFKETLKRYGDIGKFFDENQYLKEYSAGERGFTVLKYIAKRSIEDKKPLIIVDAIINFGARFIGMKLTKNKK
ncbi:glycosyltransferase family 2 protein [Clostridium sp.]|uniref:glycosyltransferase family 2 protein n=1 Tax=Clostridium sp. TaxID=1506 RepID=UPI003522728E